MFSFKTFKDKRYWILLVPYLILLLGVAVFGSNYFSENGFMLPIFMILYGSLFWISYYLWKYLSGKKKANQNSKNL